MKPPYPNAELVPSLWFPLVKKFYQEHYPSGKPNKADPIWAIRHNGKVICAVRLKKIGNEQLLTAMVTDPTYRNIGLGSHLINDIQPALNQLPSYCFALTHLVPFYSENHFSVISPDLLSEELKSRFYSYSLQGRKITAMHYLPI
ncbi:acetyltransferase [Marinomonas ushuaiensis DSM 15871]|uniref:Acetyltransferase n=1 Tax=Marinomonas ushuaiensis DSM 15871 TaxID=1122207 RepID=X7E1K6_9GAMM|nr:GNAT family N-acetyltransferase [Marinomonas ushuaiensis]ETX09934.1 acetyltransferase [Marinomonas ushuaiensis DSM 15871]